MTTTKNKKQIVAAVQRAHGERSYWTRIGTAFENSDGSWNLLFDYFPTKPGTTLQIRDIESRDG